MKYDINHEYVSISSQTATHRIILLHGWGADADDLLKLGLIKEFSEKDLCCHSYNLKTYNIKRDWNNPKGWANPENFNKYRW